LLFKDEQNLEKKKEIFKIIYYKYLNGSESELEINIPNTIKTEMNLFLKNLNEINEFDQSKIEKLILDVKLNLMDTFSRFKNSKSYINWSLNRVDTFMK
jgi:hypothetical protein